MPIKTTRRGSLSPCADSGSLPGQSRVGSRHAAVGGQRRGILRDGPTESRATIEPITPTLLTTLPLMRDKWRLKST